MIGFFEEKQGQRSSTRLIFVFGSFANILMLAGLLFINKTSPIEAATFFTMVESVLSGLKLYQNSQEKIK